jgi:hypothetical protein
VSGKGEERGKQMDANGLKLVVDTVGWMIAISIGIHVMFFLANLKLYTEIMKEKSQRNRP